MKGCWVATPKLSIARTQPTASISNKVTVIASIQLPLAGAIATMVGDVSMHPIGYIKTLQQSNEGLRLNMVAAAKTILWKTKGGLSGFFSGLHVYMVSDGLGGAFKFATYEKLKKTLLQNYGVPDKEGPTASNKNNNKSNDYAILPTKKH